MAELLARLVLASASPRRRELLATAGIDVVVAPVDADESRLPGESPSDYVVRVAAAKLAIALERAAPGDAVLCADTMVSLDGDVLGKPVDDDDARRTLALLSGREHEVTTAIAAAIRGHAPLVRAVTTRVRFRALEVATIDRYVATGEGRDKAGGYGIQGIASGFVESITGSYSNVVGLPVVETLEVLRVIGALGAWP